MTTETALVISGVVAGIVQILKLSFMDRKWGVISSITASVIAVLLWGISNEASFDRHLIWNYFTAMVTVSTSAVGIHSSLKNTKELAQPAIDATMRAVKGTGTGDT